MYYVGIDIAKLNHFASVVSSDGEVLVKPFKFTNDNTAFPYTVIPNTAFSSASHKSHTPLCPSDRCSHAAGSFPDTQDAPTLSEP